MKIIVDVAQRHVHIDLVSKINPTKKMKNITELLAEAQMSAVMVAEQINSQDCTPEANDAYNALAKSEDCPSPANNAKADKAASAWIAANDDKAREIIMRRIGVRAASVARRGY